MSRDQAKEILSGFRPGTEDERDPVFMEALELAKGDFELSAWLAEQHSFDSAVKRQLAGSVLPQGVMEQIHLGVTRRQMEAHKLRHRLMALAACLVLFLALSGVWLYERTSTQTIRFAMYRADMVRLLQRFPRLDLETSSLAHARQWLVDTQHLEQVEFPAGLQRFPTIGCRTLNWRGRSLALVCFMVDGEVVHFIVLQRSRAPEGQPASVPQFVRVAGTTTAAWSRGELTYLVLTKGSVSFLRQRL